MFKAPFSFNGRINRLEYFITFIIYIAFLIGVSAISEAVPIAGFALLPCVYFLWAQGAKRCHDIGKNGWYQIIPLFFIVLLSSKGNPGLNKYDKDFKQESIPGVLDTNE